MRKMDSIEDEVETTKKVIADEVITVKKKTKKTSKK